MPSCERFADHANLDAHEDSNRVDLLTATRMERLTRRCKPFATIEALALPRVFEKLFNARYMIICIIRHVNRFTMLAWI